MATQIAVDVYIRVSALTWALCFYRMLDGIASAMLYWKLWFSG